jgi:plastocyanin
MTSQVQSTTSIADPTTTTSGTTTSGGTDTTVGGTFELTVGAEDNEGFTRERLEGPAGTEISVTFINKDIGGEPHNWHIVVASGTEEYATTVKDAPDTQTVTFTIGTPGEYTYYCDTHSEAMKGVFTATP